MLEGLRITTENENNKVKPFCIDDHKLFRKDKPIWTDIGDLQNVKLNASPVPDDRHWKTKIRRYGDKIYTNFHRFNLLEDDAECKSFIIICTDFLLAYENKYYQQVYLDNFAY